MSNQITTPDFRLVLAEHRHSWERFELRDDDGSVYYVGYRCECGEIGYELRLAAA